MVQTFLLGLKGLQYLKPKEGEEFGTFVSPARPEFTWPREGLVQAACALNKQHENGSPDPGCSCGIYATFDRQTVSTYIAEDDKAVFLLQGWPRFICGNLFAWRAAAASVIAVVELPLNPIKLTVPDRPRIGNPFADGKGTIQIDALAHPTQNLVGEIAKEYFQIGSIPVAIALEMMERNNAPHMPR
jgi:hypothetical protein